MIKTSFKNPKKIKSIVKSGERGGEGIGPSSCPTIRKLPVQKGTNAMREEKWCTVQLKNYSHRV
jgi:hypothetical protein